jgi:transposase
VKHEFTDLFGVGGKIFLKEIDIPKLQRIALDVLMQQLESVDNEIEHVQKQIAEVAREDENIKILMTIPGIDYYSAMIIYCMLSRKENYRYERKALTESKLKRLEKTGC